MKKLLLLASLGLILIPTNGVAAAVEQTRGGSLMATITPENPSPNEEVVVNLKSYDVDLSRSQITWRLDQSEPQSGLGLINFKGQMGGLGSTQVWRVTVQAPDGRLIEKVIIFRPAQVDLLWQANTYTPAWYQGKALPTLGSTVRVAAMPELKRADGKSIPPTEIVFDWYKNHNLATNFSGAGKNYFDFTMDNPFEGVKIKVIASSIDGSLVAEKTITIPIRTPELILYPHRQGEEVVTSRVINDKEVVGGRGESVWVEPFFFPLTDWQNGKILISWLINNEPVSGGGSPRLFTPPANQAGLVDLTVRAINATNRQSAASLKRQLNLNNNVSIF